MSLTVNLFANLFIAYLFYNFIVRLTVSFYYKTITVKESLIKFFIWFTLFVIYVYMLEKEWGMS